MHPVAMLTARGSVTMTRAPRIFRSKRARSSSSSSTRTRGTRRGTRPPGVSSTPFAEIIRRRVLRVERTLSSLITPGREFFAFRHERVADHRHIVHRRRVRARPRARGLVPVLASKRRGARRGRPRTRPSIHFSERYGVARAAVIRGPLADPRNDILCSNYD